MQSRAESLIWALEGGARFFQQKHRESLRELLAEMSRQPGIAWIAITDQNGTILHDSDPGLAGSTLYTKGELARLAPDSAIKGRFAPDDPSLYETWKLFRPERLANPKKREVRKHPGTFYIFIALNSPDFAQNMDEYLRRLRLLATLGLGAILCFFTLLFYIHNFRLSKRQLAATEALASEVIANYPGGILLADLDGNIILSNKRADEFLDLRNEQQKKLDSVNYDWLKCLEMLRQGKSIMEKEIDLTMPDSHPRQLALTAIPVTGESHKQALLILRDMTELRQLRKKLSQSRRLSAIGEMASGLAHEIRNPLSSIRGYAHYLLPRLKSDPLGQATAELLVDETKRINNVLTDLLTLSRPPKLNLQRNSLQSIVQKAIQLVAPDAENKKIEIVSKLVEEAEDRYPLTDADKLLQALLNLLLNAIQFTPANGTVIIGVRPIRAQKSMPSGWLISVQDNGPGIPEDQLSQIFNPYFTTRDEGTGLGLAISRQIVESHGGEITATSTPRKGAVFSIFLPDEHK